MLESEREILTLSLIEGALGTRIVGKPNAGTNELYETIDSTNNRACELARQGAPEGTLILARQQSAGRGRQGRTWVSPMDAGISFSVLLRPKISLAKLPLITLATGVAVVRAVERSVGIRLGLKWVNDLVLNGKKVGGILAEMPGQALVIGIGLNIRLNSDELPDDLKERVDWLERASGRPVDPNLIVVELALELEHQYENLISGNSEDILKSWRSYSVTLGKEIIARTGAQEIRGKAIDISQTGALIVEGEAGRSEISAGEISIRTADGSYC
jgi:BirA family transcriptional regulator, biotin operon repressor / biotin---[acetyl-CoA-carboxylase] ligase